MENVCLKIREDKRATPFEVITTTSDVADGEQFFFSQVDGEDGEDKGKKDP